MLAGDQSEKRALLPSELKKLLKSKRVKTLDASIPPLECNPISVSPCISLTTAGRRPLGSIVNLAVSNATPTMHPIVIERPKVTWSLSSQVIITAARSSQVASSALVNKVNSTTFQKACEYYRFPFSDLPADARNKVKKLLNSKDTFEREHFRRIVQDWRKSLLSLYGLFKNGEIPYFYYIQFDMIILFRIGKEGNTEAIIARMTRTLINSLSAEGITMHDFKETDGEEEADGNEINFNNKSDKEEEEENDEESRTDNESQENIDPRKIRQGIERRVNRSLNKRSIHRSNAATSVIVKGDSDIHGLIDYLLNQKDGKSYVIIPELVAPGPFLYGSLCKADISVTTGPLEEKERHQVKVNGTILPSLVELLVSGVFTSTDQSFKINTTIDQRTDPFFNYEYLSNNKNKNKGKD